jgi:hypothetical protein
MGQILSRGQMVQHRSFQPTALLLNVQILKIESTSRR